MNLLVAGLVLAALLPVGPLPGASSVPAPPPSVCILPLGKYDRTLLLPAVRGVKSVYGMPVRVLEKQALPKSAWYEPRGRYRAEKLLAFLDQEAPADCTAMVGFTSVDISTTKGKTKDWGIFGLGQVGGKSCVVSTYRLGRKTSAKRTVKIRTIKVVNHELGHVLGLLHCPTPKCMMNDAEGKISTVDNETGLLCDTCRKEIEERHEVSLPPMQEVDWDALLKTE
jgi:archaemetzincin